MLPLELILLYVGSIRWRSSGLSKDYFALGKIPSAIMAIRNVELLQECFPQH